jgi:hypothetical protein
MAYFRKSERVNIRRSRALSPKSFMDGHSESDLRKSDAFHKETNEYSRTSRERAIMTFFASLNGLIMEIQKVTLGRSKQMSSSHKATRSG